MTARRRAVSPTMAAMDLDAIYASLAAAQPVRIFVSGFVRRPGLYGGTSLASLLHYLDQAGGVGELRLHAGAHALIAAGAALQVDEQELLLFFRGRDRFLEAGAAQLVRGARLSEGACHYRGTVACPYHGWVYDSSGKNVDIKDHATGAYPPVFEQQSHDLKAIPRLETYRGLVFGSLNPNVPYRVLNRCAGW